MRSSCDTLATLPLVDTDHMCVFMYSSVVLVSTFLYIIVIVVNRAVKIQYFSTSYSMVTMQILNIGYSYSSLILNFCIFSYSHYN